MERDKIAEERAALKEFKEKAAVLQTVATSSIPFLSSIKRKDPPGGPSLPDLTKKKSQKELLASAVRLKRYKSNRNMILTNFGHLR